jgi:hypothetical protein
MSYPASLESNVLPVSHTSNARVQVVKAFSLNTHERDAHLKVRFCFQNIGIPLYSQHSQYTGVSCALKLQAKSLNTVHCLLIVEQVAATCFGASVPSSGSAMCQAAN